MLSIVQAEATWIDLSALSSMEMKDTRLELFSQTSDGHIVNPSDAVSVFRMSLANEVQGSAKSLVSGGGQGKGIDFGERWGIGALEGKRLTSGLLDDVIVLPDFSEQAEGPFSVGSYAGGGTVPQGLRIIPYVSIAERYDSNVFFAPKLPGLERQDYVTTISPGFSLLHGTSLINTTLQATATGEVYARNTGLNYIGVNGQLGMDLSRLVQQAVPQMTLSIYNSVRYTPTPPAFIGGDAQFPTEQTSDGLNQAPQQTQGELFVRGFQLSRVNTFSNTSGLGTSYKITPKTSFRATYAYGFVQFGKSFVPNSQNAVFESRIHTLTAGPSVRVSEVDTVSTSYSYSRGESDTAFSGFESHGGFVGWHRILSPAFNIGVNGGGTYTKQDLPPGSTSKSDFLSFQGGAAISWSKRDTTATLNYTSGVYPSYFIATGPLLSHTVRVSASQRFADASAIAGSVSYGRNDALNPATSRIAQDIFYETVNADARYHYLFSRTLIGSLSYAFTYFHGTYFTGDVTDYTRHAVTLSLGIIFQ